MSSRAMDVKDAVEHVEKILTRHGCIQQGKKVECALNLWAVESVRVAEVDWHTPDNMAGAAYMQSDLPYGLAACASVERWIVALVTGNGDLVRDERANASYILTGKA